METQEWEKQFDEQPWGITRAVNVEIAGEMQGIQAPAREEIKAFIKENFVSKRDIELVLNGLKQPTLLEISESGKASIAAHNQCLDDVRRALRPAEAINRD